MEQEALWPGWQVEREIGHGSFGKVYEISRKVFDTTERAALKVISIPRNASEAEELRSEGYDDPSISAHYQSYLKTIVREYSIMSELKGNSYIVDCDDLRYEPQENGCGWNLYIKMELLTPLTQAVAQGISEEEVIRLGKDICRALILCKSKNIIHRDIKPQNIFVSKYGNYKLGDFGIAKVSEQTARGTIIGTVKYMAPEVYHNRPYGAASDLYALGMVMYWLLNEKRGPFLPLPPELPSAADEEQANLWRLRGERLPDPVHGSEALKRIVCKACEYEPENRYASASEMLEALEVLADDRQEAKPAIPVETSRHAAAENEKTDVLSRRKDGRLRPTPRRGKPRRRALLLAVSLSLLAVIVLVLLLLNGKNTDSAPAVSSQESVPIESDAAMPEPTTSSAPKTVSGANTVAFQGHHYLVCEQEEITTWEEAKAFCENAKGHLAVISSQEENDFLFSYVKENGYRAAYFGLSDAREEGAWEWVNGEALTYTNWFIGEPNAEDETEDYAAFFVVPDDGTWFDSDYGGNNGGGRVFLCEWDF